MHNNYAYSSFIAFLAWPQLHVHFKWGKGTWKGKSQVSLKNWEYLGVMISGDGRMEEEIRSRIGKAARVIGVLNEPVWKRKKLSRRTKLRVYNAIVVPTLMYGSET